MAIDYVTKPVPTDPYRIDKRVAVNVPSKPVNADIINGPDAVGASGVSVSNDAFFGA